MHDFSLPYDQAFQLRSLMMRKEETHTRDLPHVWTVTSGKGGVGKSVVAVGMAMTLAKSGRKVLLVDADENLGKLDVMMGLTPKYRINDVLMGKVTLEESLCQSSPNLFVLCGNSGSMEYPEVSSTDRDYLYAAVCNTMKNVTDIIFDTAAGMRDDVVQYASYAQDVIVVSNPEPTAIMDAYAAIKIISRKVSPLRFSVIMNNVRMPSESDDAAEKLQKVVQHFLRQEILYAGFIPHDESVAEAIKTQTPLLQKYPSSSSALCIQSVTQRLVYEYEQTERLTSMVYA